MDLEVNWLALRCQREMSVEQVGDGTADQESEEVGEGPRQ